MGRTIPYNGWVIPLVVELACESAACAPPPVGTGGSLPGGGGGVGNARFMWLRDGMSPDEIIKTQRGRGSGTYVRSTNDDDETAHILHALSDSTRPVGTDRFGEEEKRALVKRLSATRGDDVAEHLVSMGLGDQVGNILRSRGEIVKSLKSRNPSPAVMATLKAAHQELVDSGFEKVRLYRGVDTYGSDTTGNAQHRYGSVMRYGPTQAGLTSWSTKDTRAAWDEGTGKGYVQDIPVERIVGKGGLLPDEVLVARDPRIVDAIMAWPNKISGVPTAPINTFPERWDRRYGTPEQKAAAKELLRQDEAAWKRVEGEWADATFTRDSFLASGAVFPLVAACHSRECAPPPVGTGGSESALSEMPSGMASAREFRKAIDAVRWGRPVGASVYVYPEHEYADMKLFLSKDRKSGVAVKSDGDIVSAFSGGGGRADELVKAAVEAGGWKLDAFDTVLPGIYARHGFVEVGRDKWNEDYKPEGWDYSTFEKWNGGRPDVVYMELPPELRKSVRASIALVAACHSKECAPPPVGRGGSVGGGSGISSYRELMNDPDVRDYLSVRDRSSIWVPDNEEGAKSALAGVMSPSASRRWMVEALHSSEPHPGIIKIMQFAHEQAVRDFGDSVKLVRATYSDSADGEASNDLGSAMRSAHSVSTDPITTSWSLDREGFEPATRLFGSNITRRDMPTDRVIGNLGDMMASGEVIVAKDAKIVSRLMRGQFPAYVPPTSVTSALTPLVAACHSEACAPPPVGTGGSLPGVGWGGLYAALDSMSYTTQDGRKGIRLSAENRQKLVGVLREHGFSRLEEVIDSTDAAVNSGGEGFVHPHTIEAIVHAGDNFQPEIRDWIEVLTIGPTAEQRRIEAERGKSSGMAASVGVFDNGRHTLVVGRGMANGKLKRPDEFPTSIEEARLAYQLIKDPASAAEAIFNHEFGHVLHYIALDRELKAEGVKYTWSGVINGSGKGLYFDRFVPNPKGFPNTRYAQTTHGEFIAEAVALAKSGIGTVKHKNVVKRLEKLAGLGPVTASGYDPEMESEEFDVSSMEPRMVTLQVETEDGRVLTEALRVPVPLRDEFVEDFVGPDGEDFSGASAQEEDF